jgi:hypothetical protein
MVSYNDITKLTFFHKNKQNTKILDYIFKLCNSNNIIDILQFIKREKFIEESSSIKLTYDEKELIIFKENFLKNIPESEPKSIEYNEFEYTIDYPNIINFKCSPVYCIKKIKYKSEEHILKTQEDYNLIPTKTYLDLKKHIDGYITNLNNIHIYKVGSIQSRFFLNTELIINIIYLAFVSSYKNLVQEQLFLMKEFNFTYDSFSNLSLHEIGHYLKEGIKLINERNNPETQ